MTTGERIKLLRKELNLSQPKFGEKLGVTKSVIVNLELNRVELKDYMIKLICKTFDVNPLWLTSGEGEKFFNSRQHFLEDLVKEFDLTETEKKIVSNFLNLSSSEREQIITLVKKLIE